MKYRVTSQGWWLLIFILVVATLLGVIFGRTNYIPDKCEELRQKYGNTPITKDNPDYRDYLDTNNNGIACE